MITPDSTQTENQLEKYKTTEFADLLKSNNFYTVSAIALVLGFASAFGFIQNPRKLKSVVDSLTHKVSISHPDNLSMSYQVYQAEKYGFSAILEKEKSSRDFKKQSQFSSKKNYLLGRDLEVEEVVMDSRTKRGLQATTFGYDITSDNFWNDLYSSSIVSEMTDSQKELYKLQEQLNAYSRNESALLDDDSKYSIAVDLSK